MTEKFVAGIVGSPFGVKGFLKVHPCSGEIEHLLKLKSVIINQEAKEQQLNIEESAVAAPVVLMRFSGMDSPEKAKTLTGAKLIVSREDAAPLNNGEFYVEDLKGLTVTAENEGIVGQITDIIEGGGGELAEIRLPNGEKRLVPFRKEFFSEISLQKGMVILQNLWILE